MKNSIYPNIRHLTTLLIVAAGLVSTTCNAQKQKAYLLALSKIDHTLAIVDPGALEVTARIPVGTDPHEVIASTDGKTAYVSIYGGGTLHELDIIDLVQKKRLDDVDTKPLFGPHGLVFEGGKLWFTAEGSKAVGRYDPASHSIDWCMGTGQDRTHMIYVRSDLKEIYTTNVSSGSVSILTDTALAPFPGAPQHKDWVQSVIPTARGSEGFDVSPGGNELWTASSQDGSISIIDIGARKLAGKIDAHVNGANRLKFTPDGKLVFVSSLQTGEVTVFNAESRKEIKRLKPGHGAAGILMDPGGDRVFVACTPDNYIAVIDLRTLEVVKHFDVGGGPDGLAWAIQP